MKITFLVGLPGSGKTHLGRSLTKDGGIFLDDLSILGIQKLYDNLDNEHVVVADVFLCRSQDRDLAIQRIKERVPDAEINFVYFANDPEACHTNVGRRFAEGDRRRVGNMIDTMTKWYTIPDGVEILPVWRPVPK